MIDRIKGIINVEWEKIKPIQPDDVKINTNINALKKSLKKHGFSLPFAVWKDGPTIYTIDGHTRKRALEELKHEGEDVPDKLKAFEIEAKDRKEAVQILVEVFNQKHNAFDNEVLTRWLEVEDVEIQDLEAVNLSSPIIEKNEAQEDDFEIHDEIKTDIKLGDLIEIGKHRLLCGDSTDKTQVEYLMNGKLADMVFTDPPWNVNYGDVKENNAKGYKPRKILNDFMSSEKFEEFLSNTFSCLFHFSKIGCPTYIVMSSQEWGRMMNALELNEYHWSSTIIWNKNSLILSRNDYNTKYEPIYYGWKKGGARLREVANKKEVDVWDIDRPIVSGLHPTTKPIEVPSRALINSSEKGNVILDSFLGSGTTMVACEQLNRICYGMELDPKYCQVIIDRMLNSYPDIEVKINGHKYQQLLTV